VLLGVDRDKTVLCTSSGRVTGVDAGTAQWQRHRDSWEGSIIYRSRAVIAICGAAVPAPHTVRDG
jgi:hypothetical protein